MICSHCGGSNPDGATFCQFCGSTLGPAAPPLPSSLAPPPPPPPPAPAWATGRAGPPGRPRRSLGRTILIALVVIIVIIVVIAVIAYLLAPPAVTITGVNFQSADNACGLNGGSDPTQYNESAGQSFSLSYSILGPSVSYGNASIPNGTAACEIQTLTTTTPGFSISGANVPLSIPVNASQILSFNVNPPGSAYTGVLTIFLT